ncbi:MAG: hypothetical protein BWZ01_02708 [Deltaproteobacteria bacterium ADurb.BinA179]|nr:MAG: hypothetical protein BWZ01_02708 [Deltaproteobacteria bacterium ADurb.BinA179]
MKVRDIFQVADDAGMAEAPELIEQRNRVGAVLKQLAVRPESDAEGGFDLLIDLLLAAFGYAASGILCCIVGLCGYEPLEG